MRRRLAVLLAALAAAACSSDKSTGLATSLEGSYTLRVVNGQSLPFTLPAAALPPGVSRLDVTGGVVTLNRDASFSDITTLRVVQGNQSNIVADTTRGTYALTSNVVTFTAGGQTAYTMNWNGSNQLTQTITDLGPTLVLTYQK